MGKKLILLLVILQSFFIGCKQQSYFFKIDEALRFDESMVYAFGGDKFQFDNRFLIIIYITQASCMTCVNRDLAEIAKIHNEYEGVDFLLLFSEYHFDALRNTKRILKIEFPMVIENAPGILNLPEKFNISLVDINEQKSLLRYFPNPNPETANDLYVFLKEVNRVILNKTDTD